MTGLFTENSTCDFLSFSITKKLADGEYPWHLMLPKYMVANAKNFPSICAGYPEGTQEKRLMINKI